MIGVGRRQIAAGVAALACAAGCSPGRAPVLSVR
jgi:hypothetical protein